MSGTDEHPLLPGGGRVLMLGTGVMAVVAAAVLALGIQDARLLRLGLLAALWAALLGAFATARARRETSSCAEHADRLRMAYQRELEREVAARREHTLRVEHGFREQAGLSHQREIGELRTELAAMRSDLERLLGSYRRAAPVAPAEAARSPIGPELRFVPGPDSNGDGARWAAGEAPGASPPPSPWTSPSPSMPSPSMPSPSIAGPPVQRTVSDLLAAHGVASTPRRRRSHDHHPATSA
jgi:signal transduction histidine kinase